MHPHAALEQLFLSLFATDELHRFLRHSVNDATLTAALPSRTVSAAMFVSETVVALNNRGLINEALFEALVHDRSGRAADIIEVRTRFDIELTPAATGVSLEEATRLLRNFAAVRGIKLSATETAATSPFSTESFKGRVADGKGVVYCHATGSHQGQVFYVRRGIGWYYQKKLGGSESPLGLPISGEERRDSSGHSVSFFEGGHIEYDPVTKFAIAVATSSSENREIGRLRL